MSTHKQAILTDKAPQPIGPYSQANVKAVVEAAGESMDSVVKTTIYLKNMTDFPKVNEVYGKYFEGLVAPARSTVEVARLPKDVLVEVEVLLMQSHS